MGPVRRLLDDRRGWPILLAVTAVLLCLTTSLVFAPGYMSNDTIFQLKQALGRVPLNDWHPPAMSLLWKALIKVTGTSASMAVLQSVLLWLCLWVIGWQVWEATRSRWSSLAVLALGLAPHVLTFVGVVWKDVQMAFALLAVTAIALVGQRHRSASPAVRWTLFGLGTLLLGYAILVRENAIFAAIPMFVMLVLAIWSTPGRRRWLIAIGALIAGVVVPSVAISSIAKPQRTSVVSAIMLDDLLHVLTPRQLAATDVSPDLRSHLVSSAKECARIKSLSNSYWTCYGEGAHGPFTKVAHADEIKSLWVKEMAHHVPGYLQYRLDVFSQLLFKDNYVFQHGVKPNDLGITASHSRLVDALQTYITGAYRDLPWLFAGWFWLLVGLVLAVRPGRGAYAMPVRAMALSSVLYIVGYFPIMPAANYRYIYWPALAGSLALLLVWVGRGVRPAQAAATAAETGTAETGTAETGTGEIAAGEIAAGEIAVGQPAPAEPAAAQPAAPELTVNGLDLTPNGRATSVEGDAQPG